MEPYNHIHQSISILVSEGTCCTQLPHLVSQYPKIPTVFIILSIVVIKVYPVRALAFSVFEDTNGTSISSSYAIHNAPIEGIPNRVPLLCLYGTILVKGYDPWGPGCRYSFLIAPKFNDTYTPLLSMLN